MLGRNGNRNRDSDSDAIPDGLDRCSETPRGATVDALGCPGDEDGDGGLDGLDRCPRTPTGTPVTPNGCPQGQAPSRPAPSGAPTPTGQPPANQAAPAPAPAPSPTAAAGDTEVPLSQMRKAIARKMTQVKQTVPHAYTVIEVDMTNVVKWREANNMAFKAREGASLSYVAVVVKAATETLRKHPNVNSQFAEDKIIVKQAMNIGIAVAVPPRIRSGRASCRKNSR